MKTRTGGRAVERSISAFKQLFGRPYNLTIFIMQHTQFTEENTYKKTKILQKKILYLTWFYSYSYL